jgi:Zn-dependent M28 family amino/carboxypeptidase
VDGREILVTSHLDAYRDSPGANDNGTGLGLMVELARALAEHASSLRAPIVLVAFGAEENGAIGSRAFVRDHEAELGRIAAVVNLDSLGGAVGPIIASKHAPCRDASEGQGNRVPEGLGGRAWKGPDGRWRILHPEIIPAVFTSCYPDWLHGLVARSADELGIELIHLDLISDHRSLAFAGVPAIGIQSKEHHIHSADDTAAHVVPETEGAGAALAIRVLCRLQGRFDHPPDTISHDEPAPGQPPAG